MWTRMFVLSLLVGSHRCADAATAKEGSKQNKMPVVSDDMIGQLSASIMGESALVDKETGRIIWEGGTTTLSASLAPILGYGIKHARATLLTGIFILALIGSIMARLHQWIQAYFHSADGAPRPTPWPTHVLLLLANWTIFRVPQVNGKVLLATTVLYLIESYTCSTRRYLANAIASPFEVEEYIEQLRQEPPVVTWKVRCFHYERRKWVNLLRALTLRKGDDNVDLISPSALPPSPWLVSKKIVTHQTISSYNFTSCEDKTIAGVWRRAEATAANPAPFSKIVLSKLLILPTAKARESYFKQQSTFVTREGRDEYTEFSTRIQVKGFRRRMLAVRPVEGVPSAKLFRLHLFWMFTLIGLTVPYRIWFARHCDELRVTVTKEATTEKAGSSSWSWFSRNSSGDPSAEWNRIFKSKMQELALYTSGERALPSILQSGASAANHESKLGKPTLQIEEKSASGMDEVSTSNTAPETFVAESNATEPVAEQKLPKAGQPQPLPPPRTTTESEVPGDAIETHVFNDMPIHNVSEQ